LPTVKVERVAGADRVSTAVAVSKDRWRSSDLVYLVGSKAPADAVVAASHGKPVLFLHHNKVPAETLAEIRRLGASRAVIVGGTDRVSAATEDEVRDALIGVMVKRVAGADRFVTSRLLGEIRLYTGSNQVFITSGEVSADSFAAAAAAQMVNAALMLTRRDCIPTPTRQAVTGRTVVVVGDTNAITESILSDPDCG
jgi:putative cell wall-binding protein